MKLLRLTFTLLLISSIQLNQVKAQQSDTFKAKDVIEHGIAIKQGNKLFIRVQDQTLTYDANRLPKDFTTLQDSAIFLVQKNGLNIYLRPVNPLKFSYKGENKIMIDPVNAAALTALSEIETLVTKVAQQTPQQTVVNNKTGKKKTEDCDDQAAVTAQISDIQSKLQANQNDPSINEVFKKLRNMSFNDENSTKTSLEANKVDLKAIESKFDGIAIDLTDLKNSIASYDCDDKYVKQFIFNDILKDLIAIRDEQLKRLKNLQAAFAKVEEVYQLATTDMDGVKWVIRLNLVPVTEGKVSVYKIMIKHNGLELNDKGEIVSSEEKDFLTQTIRFRKFQRFVPEIAVGSAYTFFKYNEYGTATDANGVQTLAVAGQKSINNLNFTTMINFVYYTPNSNIHFLYQLGIGANAEVPTLFTGLGIRSNINGLKRLAITGGVAFTWVKELTKLKVGDVVTGTADIEKDLSHQFSWPPKPYVGLQFNF